MNNWLVFVSVFLLLTTGCGLLDVLNFASANFRVENTTEFTICGIDISDISSLSFPGSNSSNLLGTGRVSDGIQSGAWYTESEYRRIRFAQNCHNTHFS